MRMILAIVIVVSLMGCANVAERIVTDVKQTDAAISILTKDCDTKRTGDNMTLECRAGIVAAIKPMTSDADVVRAASDLDALIADKTGAYLCCKGTADYAIVIGKGGANLLMRGLAIAGVALP